MFKSNPIFSFFFAKKAQGSATPAAPEDREKEIQAMMAEFEQDSIAPIAPAQQAAESPVTPTQNEEESTKATTTIKTTKQRNQPAGGSTTLSHALAHSSKVVVQGGKFALNELYKVATAPIRIALSPVVAVAAHLNVPKKIGLNSIRTHYRMHGPMSVTYYYF